MLNGLALFNIPTADVIIVLFYQSKKHNIEDAEFVRLLFL